MKAEYVSRMFVGGTVVVLVFNTHEEMILFKRDINEATMTYNSPFVYHPSMSINVNNICYMQPIEPEN